MNNTNFKAKVEVSTQAYTESTLESTPEVHFFATMEEACLFRNETLDNGVSTYGYTIVRVTDLDTRVCNKHFSSHYLDNLEYQD
jgi:hypothetical protein